MPFGTKDKPPRLTFILRSPWPLPLDWNPGRRSNGRCSAGASCIWFAKKFPQARPEHEPTRFNRLFETVVFLGEDQTPANNGPNDLYSFIYGLAYELSGLATPIPTNTLLASAQRANLSGPCEDEKYDCGRIADRSVMASDG